MWRSHNRYNLTETALSAVGQTAMINSSAFRNQGFTLITTGFTGTIQFYASNSDLGITPNLSQAASATNEYSVVQTINLQNGNTIDGDTWVALVTDTSVTRYEFNDNNNSYVGAAVTARTAGSVIIRVDLTDNQ